MEELIFTEHAYQRAKERFSWKKKTLERMSNRAFKKGIKYEQTKGNVRDHINLLFSSHGNCNNTRIYGETIYLFEDFKLITLYRLNNDVIKHIKLCKDYELEL